MVICYLKKLILYLEFSCGSCINKLEVMVSKDEWDVCSDGDEVS